jgi:membrane protein implicated in regulation of membrane protease activity
VRLLPFVAALVVIVEAIGAALFFLDGLWLPGVVLALAVVASVWLAGKVRRAVARPAPTAGYVEREQQFF